MKAVVLSKQQKWLRFLLPVPVGMVVYVMILLVFDTLDQLGANFFSQEVVVTILFSFILMELLRIALNAIERRYPLALTMARDDEQTNVFKVSSQSLRIYLIPLLALLIAIVIISLLVSVYYSFVLLISDYRTELIVFNGVYGVVAILYAIIHVSNSFLAVHKQIHYRQEKELRKGMETDLEKFKMQINPQLLYDGLESLISIVHAEPRMAEQFVNQLSKIYRYNLDHRHAELVDLAKELELSRCLLHLLNIKHHKAISFSHQLSDECLGRQIIPCTLSSLIQEVVRRSIVNAYQPLCIRVEQRDDVLLLSCNHNPKIGLNGDGEWDLSLINKAYAFFTDQRQLEVTYHNQYLHITIPLFDIEEE
ncbi:MULTISPECIES: histidine kinase [unclassified Carboxylicivirga]|uniref:histidine kinase n=1 Tax=Carboxylicivirga TaxID=1628153 RepID=UPI003D34A695